MNYMKSLSFFCFLISNSLLFSQNIIENGMKQGSWIGYHENGKIKYKGQFYNDMEYGLFSYFDVNENLVIELNYVDTGVTSLAKIFHLNGKIKSEGEYTNKLKTSTWVSYDYDGMIISSEEYMFGKLNGICKYYFKNGSFSEISRYLNGKKNGLSKQYYSNGLLSSKINYENGFRHGLCQFFYNNIKNSIESEGQYNIGLMDSIWIFYDENKSLLKKETYFNGTTK